MSYDQELKKEWDNNSALPMPGKKALKKAVKKAVKK